MSYFTAEQIADALKSPLENVKKYWPLLEAALIERGMKDLHTQAVALATVAAECRTFKPINEYGGPAYFFRMYDPGTPDPERKKVAKALGNTQPGDGVKFHGRGFVQLTGRANYAKYGKLLGVDLETHPELALDDKQSCRIFAAYFHDHGVDVWANKAFAQTDPAQKEVCFKKCRRLVNGGLNGYAEFRQAIKALTGV